MISVVQFVSQLRYAESMGSNQRRLEVSYQVIHSTQLRLQDRLAYHAVLDLLGNQSMTVF